MPDDVTQQEIIKHSVTRDDVTPAAGGVFRFILPNYNYGIGHYSLPSEPPPYWSQERDFVLASTVYREAMWGSAVAIAASKMSSLAWEVSGDIPLRVKRGQELLLNADAHAGWTPFLFKHLRAFLCTDNGAGIEIVRATRSIGSRIIGIMHLDPHRITRTGDPEIPAIYRDRKGHFHEMKAHQIILLSDMPDPSDSYFGVGLCAASRAYPTIYKLGAMESFVREKVGGLRPLEIDIVSGLLDTQLKNAISTAKEEATSRGVASYMGAIVIAVPSDTSPGLVRIPLAEMPDGFDRKQEFDIAVLTYANSLGLDVQDLQPLTGQALGTGAQSQVLDEKAGGKGLASWRQQFTHAINEQILPDLTEFIFIEKDFRDMQKKAEISKARAEGSKVRIEAGITTAIEERNLLVDMDELPKEMLNESTDITPGDVLSDSEKPTVTDETTGGPTIPESSTELPPVDEVLKEAKEISDDDISQLIQQEKSSAVELYEKAILEK